MPVTISYDVAVVGNNDRNYIRSMLERFHWQRLGGSVFRYDGVDQGGMRYEDWLNDIVPSLMFLRSFLLRRGISLKFLTIDASSISFLDHSDSGIQLGVVPQNGQNILLGTPTNSQSSEATIRQFIDATTAATQ